MTEETGYVKPEHPASEVTSRIIAAAQRVHLELGPSFQELIYQRALALELPTHSLEFNREAWINVHYRGKRVGRKRGRSARTLGGARHRAGNS